MGLSGDDTRGPSESAGSSSRASGDGRTSAGVRAGGEARRPFERGRRGDAAAGASLTPLTPLTGDGLGEREAPQPRDTPVTPVAGLPAAAPVRPLRRARGDEVPAPANRDTPETTPMASAPTPLEGDHAVPPPPPEPETMPGSIGRYVVLKRLGSGGMGVVYAAYDEELGRKVALKVLRTRVTQSKRETAKQRLKREAQSMARLSHPNVVGIYDVGTTLEDQVYVVMEFVHGTTLTRWLQAERRTWPQVLEVYVQAGRGLCAAHKAGIIHRDFKPDNVLIDREGRVRVVDFGLARADGGSGAFPRPDTYADAIKPMASSSMLNMRITRTGGMTGTPAYMAPEQYLGQPTDARTDQFSFCVALYEGLYGVRPFLGERVAVVREAVLSGQIQDVPKDSTVPPWLRRILCRGLTVRPEERFKSMDELLARLADDPRRPARRWLAAGAALAVIGAGALIVRDLSRDAPHSAPTHALCDSEAALAGVWDAGRRAQVAMAVGAAASPTDARALRVAAVLDDYAASWRDAVAAVCVPPDPALRARGASFDQRAACLQRRVAGLKALTDALVVADRPAAEHALAAAWALPAARSCEDAAAAVAAPQREALARLDAAAVAATLGELGAGLARTKAVVDEAVKTDDLPLQAEGLYRQASLEHLAGDDAAAERSLHGALWAAEASQRGDLEIDSLTLLLEVMGRLGKDADAVTLWPRLTRSLLERRDDGLRESAALHAFGRVLLRRGQHPEAVTQLELALRLCERNLGATHPQVGEVTVDLAIAHTNTGTLAEATRLLDGAVTLLTRALGDRDPALGRAYLARAEARRRGGLLREAADDYRRAGEHSADDELRLAAVRLGQSQVAADEGRWGDAAEGFAVALALAEQARGPTDVLLVEPLLGQCAAASTLGRHEQAVAAGRRALDVADRAHSAAASGPARVALARALWAQAQAAGTASPEVRAQILELARAGLTELQRAPHPDPAKISATATWIAEHGRE
ncbi:MAG: protein kinase [Myxococcales bacterium]|nr:protein kinase [Myxococcales bacterium]